MQCVVVSQRQHVCWPECVRRLCGAGGSAERIVRLRKWQLGLRYHQQRVLQRDSGHYVPERSTVRRHGLHQFYVPMRYRKRHDPHDPVRRRHVRMQWLELCFRLARRLGIGHENGIELWRCQYPGGRRWDAGDLRHAGSQRRQRRFLDCKVPVRGPSGRQPVRDDKRKGHDEQQRPHRREREHGRARPIFCKWDRQFLHGRSRG